MAGTTNFGPVTLNPGTSVFGPTALADTDTALLLTVDRTITGGFNSKTSAVTAKIAFQQSSDGGATWVELVSTTFAGGTFTMHGGLPVNSQDVGTGLLPGTGRQGQAVVTISGGSVAVQGSLVIS